MKTARVIFILFLLWVLVGVFGVGTGYGRDHGWGHGHRVPYGHHGGHYVRSPFGHRGAPFFRGHSLFWGPRGYYYIWSGRYFYVPDDVVVYQEEPIAYQPTYVIHWVNLQFRNFLRDYWLDVRYNGKLLYANMGFGSSNWLNMRNVSKNITIDVKDARGNVVGTIQRDGNTFPGSYANWDIQLADVQFIR